MSCAEIQVRLEPEIAETIVYKNPNEGVLDMGWIKTTYAGQFNFNNPHTGLDMSEIHTIVLGSNMSTPHDGVYGFSLVGDFSSVKTIRFVGRDISSMVNLFASGDTVGENNVAVLCLEMFQNVETLEVCPDSGTTVWGWDSDVLGYTFTELLPNLKTLRINAGGINSTLFAGHPSLESVEFFRSGDYVTGDGVFMNCTNLKSIKFSFSNGVYSLYPNYFKGCSALTEVTIPADKWGSTHIHQGVFDDCTNLMDVYFPGAYVYRPMFEYATQGYAQAFANTPIANGIGRIHVPESLLADYLNPDGSWASFLTGEPDHNYTFVGDL